MYNKVRESILFIEKEEEKDCLPARSFLFALVIFSCKKIYCVQKCAYTISHKYLAHGYSKMH